jgi:two-component system response regulator AlgR
MNELSVIIVDDEALARERLGHLLSDMEGWQQTGEAATGEQLLELCQTKTPDVILLDIRMPGIDGLEAANHLQQLKNPPAIIFTTAYDEYALQAFDANAIGYLLKPVRRERLLDALSKAKRLTRPQLVELKNSHAGETRSHVCARKGGVLQLIPMQEILYFQADHKYVNVFHDGGNDLIEESLTALEQEFSHAFVRLHRSYLAAVAAIESIGKNSDGQPCAWLRGTQTSLPISRRHLTGVKQRLREGR